MGLVKRIWYLSPMRAAKVQASLCIRAVSPEPPLLAHTSIESRGTFRQKARSLAPLNGWACAVKICHDGMLEDTNSLDGAHILNCLSKQGMTIQESLITTLKLLSRDLCRHIYFNISENEHIYMYIHLLIYLFAAIIRGFSLIGSHL